MAKLISATEARMMSQRYDDNDLDLWKDKVARRVLSAAEGGFNILSFPDLPHNLYFSMSLFLEEQGYKVSHGTAGEIYFNVSWEE